MGPHQTPLVPTQNPLTPNQRPSATPPTASKASTLGVRPAAELSTAFLTQAFAWRFVGLLLTAGVAAVVQGNERLLDFAGQWTFLILIAQLGLVFAIAGAINRISATAALGLFFAYAASVGFGDDGRRHRGCKRAGLRRARGRSVAHQVRGDHLR